MSSVCKSSVGCVDARDPVRATFVSLYKWPESDAEFVKSVTSPNGTVDGGPRWGSSPRVVWGSSPRVVDGYSCRQMYLRSYTFSKKESFPEKTLRCFGKVKEKATVVCPFLHRRSVSVDSIRSNTSQKDDKKKKKKKKKRKKKNKKKRCVAAKKLLDFIFRRLLSCTTRVDVIDRSSPI